MPIDARERLIVALDVPNAEEAKQMVRQLDGVVSFFKVGLELFCAAGPDIVRGLVSDGLKVFLDLKFLDIDATVQRAVQQVATLGATFLTVHESGQTVAAAVQGASEGNAASGSDTKILAVTVLTNLDAPDLQAMGIEWPVAELVLHRAKRAIAAGAHGVVASGREAVAIRALAQSMSSELLIVTPGIRPAGAETHEQKRAATPAEAIASGSDFLVVGRPIVRAPNPRDAAQRALDEMQGAFDSRSR